ncbi:DUF2017 family protein [Trueperella pyogenes]|uniref:DUF2017 family protein n=1 Tax=Trueperella pyogenes TaxID=1661 RepID=A0ABV3N9N8_9ACTO|nr:DUF2017 family protein [Trueperella pyogenes]AWA43194.1 DUF2017 domain-containing protein [Trueperella pyogenes]AZR00655.1 DUF2017 family protein [Trueperella pyogenes]AZR01920.1 DUF2017 family protein [Trueperella pyogenes]MCI7690194.1 DUF2017 domain-containing protein [Trueperella pyogenes]MDF2420576.1 DUF2017 family protein [Trueperella pyogenes]
MLTAFRIVRGGYCADADVGERGVIAGLAKDVVYLLGSDVDHEAERRSQTVDPDDPLAQLEADVVDIVDAIAQEEPRTRAPYNIVIERLLPDMSEDPDEAAKLRELTETSIAAEKIENLVTVYQGLESVPKDSTEVIIANEEAAAWMSALNDIRIVLAAHLGIDDDAAAQAVADRARPFQGQGEQDREPTSEDMLAIVYSMVTWWQDSLVGAVRNKALRG